MRWNEPESKPVIELLPVDETKRLKIQTALSKLIAIDSDLFAVGGDPYCVIAAMTAYLAGKAISTTKLPGTDPKRATIAARELERQLDVVVGGYLGQFEPK